MAGHSQFKNIMHRKGGQDAKRAKIFNKLAREITVAAKAGLPDPASNPRLRAARTAERSRAFMFMSGRPIFAATVISRASFENSFDFWASCRPLRCMMFLNWEWPAMRFLSGIVSERDGVGNTGVIGRQTAKSTF